MVSIKNLILEFVQMGDPNHWLDVDTSWMNAKKKPRARGGDLSCIWHIQFVSQQINILKWPQLPTSGPYYTETEDDFIAQNHGWMIIWSPLVPFLWILSFHDILYHPFVLTDMFGIAMEIQF